VKKISFTAQELKILKLICKQLTAKEIATKIGLSFRTVEDYRRKIQKKVGARNVVGIAIYAIKHELIRV